MTSDLRTRVLSALVIGPLAVGAVVLGGALLDALLAIGAGIIAWEWARICGVGRSRTPAAVLAASTPVAVLMVLNEEPVMAAVVTVAGMTASAVRAWVDREAGAPRVRPAILSALGLLYGGAPMAAYGLLRGDPTSGLELAFWILLVVWATDVGAYAAGRLIGGPRLAPRVSPSKTWAGLGGGMLAAGLVGGGVGVATGLDPVMQLAAISAILAVVAQAGDLGESMLKRSYGCKDSGRLIPGHGGLMDRLDGFLAVSAAVYVGFSVFGRSGIPWQ